MTGTTAASDREKRRAGGRTPHADSKREARGREAVCALNTAAFGSDAEAGVVELRREALRSSRSWPEEEGGLVGHIMFSPVALPEQPALRLMELAPMGVAPAHQRRDIGSALVRAGLERCRALGCGAVFVLGHPEYYPRFGFAPASRFGIGCPYDAPEEAFMALEIEPGHLRNARGTVKYHAAFDRL